jgi:hypothetical protein
LYENKYFWANLLKSNVIKIFTKMIPLLQMLPFCNKLRDMSTIRHFRMFYQESFRKIVKTSIFHFHPNNSIKDINKHHTHPSIYFSGEMSTVCISISACLGVSGQMADKRRVPIRHYFTGDQQPCQGAMEDPLHRKYRK